MTIPELGADCARCEALCCVALAFDAGTQFAFDKPAGRPCPNLSDTNACRIHETREAQGMGGCVRFDCLGAGQYVSQRLFPGQSWRSKPEVLAPMMAAFSLVRQIHALIELLDAAGRCRLSPADEAARTALLNRLAPAGGWTRPALAGFAIEPERTAVTLFLRSLGRSGDKSPRVAGGALGADQVTAKTS